MILLMPLGICFIESKYLDYMLSLYPTGWQEKAIQFSSYTDYFAIFIVSLIVLRLLFIICHRNKNGLSASVDTADAESK